MHDITCAKMPNFTNGSFNVLKCLTLQMVHLCAKMPNITHGPFNALKCLTLQMQEKLGGSPTNLNHGSLAHQPHDPVCPACWLLPRQ